MKIITVLLSFARLTARTTSCPARRVCAARPARGSAQQRRRLYPSLFIFLHHLFIFLHHHICLYSYIILTSYLFIFLHQEIMNVGNVGRHRRPANHYMDYNRRIEGSNTFVQQRISARPFSPSRTQNLAPTTIYQRATRRSGQET